MKRIQPRILKIGPAMIIFVSLLCLLYCCVSRAEMDLQDIVNRYQEEYSRPFIGKMEMRRVKPGKEDRISVFAVWIKNKDYTLVRFLAPVREKGTAFLKNGDQMYFYLPTVSKTIRISSRQRILDSDFSSADILGMDLAADYDFHFEGYQTIENMEYYILLLKAKNRTAAYDKIRLWLRKTDLLPGKEEFYTSSGKLLHILNYEDYNNIAGEIRPTRMVMKNTLAKGQYTVVTILEASFVQDIPDEIFTLFHLKRGY